MGGRHRQGGVPHRGGRGGRDPRCVLADLEPPIARLRHNGRLPAKTRALLRNVGEALDTEGMDAGAGVAKAALLPKGSVGSEVAPVPAPSPSKAADEKEKPGGDGDVRVARGVAAFYGLSALFHSLVASPLFYGRYVAGLLERHNYFRWVEYSLSSSIMIVLIAQIVGIFDVAAIIAIIAIIGTHYFHLLDYLAAKFKSN